MAGKQEQEAFHGFTPQGLLFFRDLAENNTKEWFEAHRSEYERTLLAPLKALTAALSGVLLEVDPMLQTAPARVVSRIHRDTRFSREKSPYKTNLWLSFKRSHKDWQLHPCWFFEMAADWYRYGMGYYSAPKSTMDALRRELELRPKRFRTVIAPLENSAFAVEGDLYRKPLRPDLPEDLRTWHQRKSFYVTCNRQPDDTLFSPRLVQEMKEGFRKLASLYAYLWELETGE